MEGLLYLADGSVYRGKGFGHPATNVGELVFNTAMTGYQGILTDPSYSGQIINMTYPLIGNYGVSEVDNQSDRIHAFGFVARDITFRPSNRMCVMSISDWLEQQGVPGIYNVDTRAITKKIRLEGTLKCVISNEGISRDEAKKLLEEAVLRTDYMREAGVKEVTSYTRSPVSEAGKGLKIAVLDFGVKRNILKGLTDLGCEVVLFPYGTTAQEILAIQPDGLLLSNGPGDPEACELGIKTTRELIGKLPMFGICMGHQVIALAIGGTTYKLKYGHRGANHGVKNMYSDKSVITSQNHSFAVEAGSAMAKDMIITHINLNDNSVEGMKHKALPIFSVQYHPEGAPGPHDSHGLFERFVTMVKSVKEGTWKDGAVNA